MVQLVELVELGHLHTKRWNSRLVEIFLEIDIFVNLILEPTFRYNRTKAEMEVLIGGILRGVLKGGNESWSTKRWKCENGGLD